MKKYFLFVFVLLLINLVRGQKQANVWHFGGNFADTLLSANGICIDFTSGVPVEVPGSAMRALEGTTSYCDSLGNILFYTNGGGRLPIDGGETGHIWNKNNQVMYSMNGLEGGGWSSNQSSIAFEAPGELNMYYLFTMDEVENNGARGLTYFKIDMTLNGGLGGVSVANQFVYGPSFESLAAIKNKFNDNYWIIIRTLQNDLMVYGVDNMGVHLNQTYDIDFDNWGSLDIKVSPNGSLIFSGWSLFNFNSETGIIGNKIFSLTDVDFLGHMEFSPNSKYLYGNSYCENDQCIVRFDLESDDPVNSREILEITPNLGFGQFQLAADRNIYFLSCYSYPPSSVVFTEFNQIKCPNSEQPEINKSLFTWDPNKFFPGLPNYSAHLFEKYDNYSLTGLTSMLEGESTQLEATGGIAYLWSPNSNLSCSDCSNPIASPTSTTTYNVLITGENGCVAEKAIEIKVKEVDRNCIYIPNIFSPNFDLNNDTFCALGECLKSGTFTIYNSWGEKIFETNDITNCWDGTYKGEPVNSDVFVYKLNGVLVTGEVIEESGSIEVVR